MMPSALHEALAQLFRNRPELAPELLERGLGVSMPAFAEALVQEAGFADLQPAEYRADLVVLLSDGAPVLAIVVEVQLARDRRKLFSWPMYVAGLRARYRCPVAVLVLTTSDEVAAWARAPIVIGPGNTFSPLVIGSEAIPLIISPEEAVRDPELTVLSVMAHGRTDDVTASALVRAAAHAVHAVDAVDPDRAMLYSDLVAHSLGAARAFEELMKPDNYEFQSEMVRRYVSTGRAEGLAVGKAEGLAVGKAEGVLLVLRTRGIVVSDAAEARIRASHDLGELDRWLVRAIRVETAEALFD